MKIWIACSRCLIRSVSLCFSFLLLCTVFSPAQSLDFQLREIAGRQTSFHSRYDFPAGPQQADNTAEEEYPDPNSVMYKSMIIPGWGQVTNRQAWKVPIVYGLLGGLTYYSIYLTEKYHDYRAAYYNAVQEGESDLRFGPTPSYIPESANPQSLRFARDRFRNRRDFIYVTVVLAYGLNIVDAYVYAHMRSFDVSDDLSMRTTVKPEIFETGSVGMTVSFELFSTNKRN